MSNFTKIDAKDLKVGMRFSAPVFFDDGENMFLAEKKSVKPYHLAVIKRWNIKYFLTYGRLISDGAGMEYESPVYELEELEECSVAEH